MTRFLHALALAALLVLARLNPKYAVAYNNRAWAYFKWGKAAKGLPDVNRALEVETRLCQCA